jgi:precorrin-8X/cobalt-precorrin-8 methylmutase
MHRIQKIAPDDIEGESFRMIEDEFHQQTGLTVNSFDSSEFAVLRRAIHATGDFSFTANIRFSENSVDAGITAIRAGKNILTDVNMAAAGISRTMLESFGGKVICKVAETGIVKLAKERNKTRSQTAIEEGLLDNVGIVAIGNAPTALLSVMELIAAGKAKPDLVIGVPVGFVNAPESKEILHEQDYPFITCLGRKGGTTVSVAIVNALIRLS